jgi:hypothetical protein
MGRKATWPPSRLQARGPSAARQPSGPGLGGHLEGCAHAGKYEIIQPRQLATDRSLSRIPVVDSVRLGRIVTGQRHSSVPSAPLTDRTCPPHYGIAICPLCIICLPECRRSSAFLPPSWGVDAAWPPTA